MSSILKALEKVERERNGRRDGLTSTLSSAGKRRSPWALPLGIAIGAVAAALATFAAMGGFSKKGSSTAAPSAPAAVAARPAVPAEAKPLSAAKGDAAKQAQLPVTTSPTVPLQKKVASRNKERRHDSYESRERRHQSYRRGEWEFEVSEVAAVPPPATKPPTVSVSAPSIPPPHSAPAPAPAPVPAPLPEVRVSGIALQNNGDTSFAIVNGRPVAKGGTVDGARVEEILSDKVRFSSGGRRFDVKVETER